MARARQELHCVLELLNPSSLQGNTFAVLTEDVFVASVLVKGRSVLRCIIRSGASASLLYLCLLFWPVIVWVVSLC